MGKRHDKDWLFALARIMPKPQKAEATDSTPPTDTKRQLENATTEPDLPSTPNTNHLDLSDSIGLGALVITVILWIVVPNFLGRLIASLLAVFGAVFLCYWSTWTRKFSLGKRHACAIVLTLLLGFLLGSHIVGLQKEEEASATTGELNSGVSKNPDDAPIISFGPRSDGVRWAWRGPMNQAYMSIYGDKLSVRKDQGRMLFTTEVRDRDGKRIVWIKDNHWYVNRDQSICLDKNFTRDTLEVLDGRGRVVLQVFSTPDVISVQGEWWTEDGKGVRIYRPYPYVPNHPQPDFLFLTKDRNPREPHIEPIFKYPSSEHLGEFVDGFTQ